MSRFPILAFLTLLAFPLFAAPPPELTVLRQQYEKAVIAPYSAAQADLDAKFITALGNAATAAKQAGKLEEVLAIQNDQKCLTEKLPLPDDDEKTPDPLKKLRSIYREQLAKLEAQRAANHAGLLPAYTAKLRELEANLTKVDRIDEAKEVMTYREGLSSTDTPVSMTLASSGSSKAGRVVVWQMNGKPLDEKMPLVKEMPGPKVKVHTLISPGNPRSWYLLAIQESGKLIGWPAVHGSVNTMPKDLKKPNQVVCGYTGAAAIDSSGKLKVWGNPDPVASKLKFISIAMGSFQILGIDEQGQVHGFALDKRAGACATVPPGIGPAVSVHAGDNVSMVRGKDGSLWVWTTDKAEPKKVEIDQVRSAHWFYRNGIVVRTDGSCRNITTQGANGPLPVITDPFPEEGDLTSDDEGHYAVCNARLEWKFYGKDLDADYCSKQAAGCTQIEFRAGLVFGIKPE